MGQPSASLRMPPPSRLPLKKYLNDHFESATAGLEVCKRCLSNNPGGELGSFLSLLVREIDQDRKSLLALMRCLGIKRNLLESIIAWVSGRVNGLKPNHQPADDSPIGRVLDLEQLTLDAYGKLAMWRVLHRLSHREPVLANFDFSLVMARAERQRRDLEHFRVQSGWVSLALTPKESKPGAARGFLHPAAVAAAKANAHNLAQLGGKAGPVPGPLAWTLASRAAERGEARPPQGT